VEEEAKRAEQEYRKAHRKLTRDPRYDRAKERKEEWKRSTE
jgi:hypothetical protein